VIANSLLRRVTGLATGGIRLGVNIVSSLVEQVRGDASSSSRSSSSGEAPASSPASTVEPPPAAPSPETAHRRAAAKAAKPATQQEREAIAETIRDRQPDVGELADPDLDVAEVQAQLQAKHTVEAHEEERELRHRG
jgi:uncharacterized membrane protein